MSNTNMETLSITVESDEGDTDLILTYRSLSKNTTELQWNNLVDNLETNMRTIIMGDMNAKNTEWNCADNDTQGIRLAKVVEERDLFVANRDTLSRPASGSQRASNIDLIIVNFQMLQSINAENSGLTLGSNHQILNIHTAMSVPPLVEGKRFSTRKYNYKKTNWNTFRSKIEEESNTMIQNEPEPTTTEAEDEVEIRNTIYRSLEVAGAAKAKQHRKNQNRANGNKTKRGNKQRWWDEDCDKAIEEKRRALIKFNRRPNDVTWQAYKISIKKVRATVKRKKREAWEKFAESVNRSSDCRTLSERV
ncbi:uncharacterized protein LOC114881753 isoform X1 [Osmia bicornis bicornis]|uniref:uncharacterized protein LOC114881753 isoform X1 n=1 Tax=Osmia bicornis bicornis TaxID=1437191 RepID=UPI001EAF8B65|nr:uncharacterized protein LOC114881753 isoform X1 [Osmia bicornis bicornis]XP_046145822.1 uncharacterized protein LOC114881753 isoform X1 [Osmia bicornis bicornis]